MMSATSTLFQSHINPPSSSAAQQKKPINNNYDGGVVSLGGSTTKSGTEAGQTTLGNYPNEKKDLSTSIDELLTQHLATSVHTMSTRNQSINEVCDHLEQQYLAAKRLGGDDQSHFVVNQTKEQLTRAVEIMNNDLFTIANQFDQLLLLQDSSLSSLTAQVDLLNTRINAIKSQHLKTSLQEMQLPLPLGSTSLASSHNVAAVRDISRNDIVLPKHLTAMGTAGVAPANTNAATFSTVSATSITNK